MCTEDITKEQMDIICMRHVYDYDEMVENYFHGDVLMNRKLREIFLAMKFDEHDFHHRSSCFKKSDKCRFEYPKEISNETVLEFDKDEANEVIWYYLEKPPCKITGFRIKQKRTHGDQFLNTHSIPTRDLLACNTNVQLGCINHMYYATHYASK